MTQQERVREDPLSYLGNARTWFHTRWLKSTYPFAKFGNGVSIHYSCEIPRWSAPDISFGNNIYLAQDVWLVAGPRDAGIHSQLVLGNGCKIGRRSSIAARNTVILEDDVLFAPNVLIRDHNHEFSDINRPILTQGLTAGGDITIERNCWLGYGAVVLCGAGHLTIGRNSIIGANCVVIKSVPPFSIVAGNPAKIIKSYDPATGKWVKSAE